MTTPLDPTNMQLELVGEPVTVGPLVQAALTEALMASAESGMVGTRAALALWERAFEDTDSEVDD